MRRIALVLLLVPTALSSGTLAQSGQPNQRKNILEFSLPLAHYFDGGPTNWLIWFPSQRHDKEYFPSMVNIQFTRWLGHRSGLRLSVSAANIKYFKDGLVREKGDPFHRNYRELTLGYLHTLRQSGRFHVSGLGEVTFRHGWELYIINEFTYEYIVDGVELSDFGLSAGAHADYKIYRPLFLFSELKYTRQLIRKDRGDPPYYTGDKGSSRNILTFKLGLGIQF